MKTKARTFQSGPMLTLRASALRRAWARARRKLSGRGKIACFMTRGRKKLPQEVLDLRGTARKDRARPYVATTGGGLAEIQCWTAPGYSELSDRAKDIYRRYVRAGNALKILEAVDLAQLVAFAREYDTYLAATEDIKLRGFKYSYMDAGGNIRWATNPAVSVANSALTNMRSLSSNFGFSPVDRQKLHVPEDNPLDRIKELMITFENSGPDNQ